MAGTRDKYQIVFLIDLSTGVPENETDVSADQITPCICLSALRILTHLTSHVPDLGSGQVKWGFKFYNSISRLLQKYKFRDFSVKDFEEFETRVDSVIESEKTKAHGFVKDRFQRFSSFSESETSRDCFGSTCTEDDSDPVDKLQNALRDIVTDFQWDCPDICSPVRSSARRRTNANRKRSILEDDEPRQQNMTFLFSRCPYNPSTMASFAGVAEDAAPQDVLSSFLPTSIYRQFYENAKIRLFWVDLNADPGTVGKLHNKDYSLHGISLMHDALTSVGGGVLPVNALLQMGTYSSTPLNRLVQEPAPSATPFALGITSDSEDQPRGLVLPTSVLLKSYLHDPLRGHLPQPEVFSAQLIRKSGYNHEKLCDLEMHTVMVPKETDRRKSDSSRRQNLYCYELEVDVDECSSGAVCTTLPVNTTVTPGSSRVTRSIPPSLPIESTAILNTLSLRGTVSSGDLPLECLQTDKVFTVNITDSESGPFFSHLLQELARQQMCLVVDYECGSYSVPQLAVLQPLTSLLATLTLVRSQLAVNIEKILVFSNGRAMSESHVSNEITGMEAFIAKTVKHLYVAEKTNSSAATGGDDGQRLERIQTTGFHASVFESWMTGSVTGSTTDALIQSLRNSEEDEKVESTEVHALRSVQKLYHDLKYARPSTRAPSTPKKKSLSSPRKTPRKSPRKTPRKTPRKSPGKALQAGKGRKTPRKTPNKKKQTGKASGKTTSKALAAGLGRSRSFTAPMGSFTNMSRTNMIIQRSREVQSSVDGEDEGEEKAAANNTGRPATRSHQANKLPTKDFQSESDLVEFLHMQYESGVSGESSPLSVAQAVVSVALHYVKSTNAEEAEKATQALLECSLLKTMSHIKEQCAASGADDDTLLRHYQLQMLLQLELESLLAVTGRNEEDQAGTVAQVSAMLTRMSLLKDAVYTSTFMKETLLENYVDTTPRLLGNIYEELLMPLPEQLESLFSGSEEDTISQMSSVQQPSVRSSIGSIGSCSNPGSHRTTRNRRTLTTIPSLAGVTKRQIAIPVKAKVKDKGKDKEKKKTKRPTRAASAKKVKPPADDKSEMKLVRRNLFMGEQSKVPGKLERHKSVAVMESTRGAPKTPNKRIQKIHQTTPKAHHILKTKKVAETPVHKQVPQVLWRRLEKERQRARTVSDVHVVMESPDKAPSRAFTKVTMPRRSSLGIAKRKSFYSDGPQAGSRNVQKYKQLEARMTNMNPLVSPNAKVPQKSSPPRRIQPINLFANLNSPSPPKRVHYQPVPVPANVETNVRSFTFDSPSKNTRTRSLFAPPEIERPDGSPRKSMWGSPKRRINTHLESRMLGSSSAHGGGSMSQPIRTSPRRIVLQNTFLSPQKGFSQPAFSSPQKNRTSFLSPVKSRTPVKMQTPQKTPDRRPIAVSPELLTPRRSQRQICPATPDMKAGQESHTTPGKRTPSSNRLSLLMGSPTRDQSNMLENWAQKALRQTPQRKARSLSQAFAEFGSHDDTVSVGDLGLPSPPRKKGNRTPYSTGRPSMMAKLATQPTHVDVQNVENSDIIANRIYSPVVSPNRVMPGSFRRSPRFSPNQPEEKIMSPGRCTRLSVTASPSQVKRSERNDPIKTDTPGGLKGSDSNSFTPPLAKSQKSATEVTPSHKFKAGRITPEPSSPLDSWPRKKQRSTASQSSVCKKLDQIISNLKTNNTNNEDDVRKQDQSKASISSESSTQSQVQSEFGSAPLLSSQSSGWDFESGISCIDSNSNVTRINMETTVTLRYKEGSVGSTPRSKRKLSSLHGNDANSDNYCSDTHNTPTKRRRTIPYKRSSVQTEVNSLECVGSPEVFEPQPSAGSTKENSPTDDHYSSNHPKYDRVRLLRNCSAGSTSNSNLDSDFVSSPVMSPAKRAIQRMGLLESGSDNDPSLPASPVFKHSAATPPAAESPTSVGGTPSSVKNFSPSISSMSLVHLMQSPLVEASGNSAGTDRDTVSRRGKSRRSLYRTKTSMEGDM